MLIKDKECLPITLIFCIIPICLGQNFWKVHTFDNPQPVDDRTKIIWCTINVDEQQKCNGFASAIERDKYNFRQYKFECLQAASKDECISYLDQGKATLTTLDAGQIFIGGRYHSLVPIAQEVFENGFQHYYSVAAIKRGSLEDVSSLNDLRGKKACFAGVETFAGWILPISTLMKRGGMDILDCNNHVKTATQYFGPSCAVNCLTDKFNPIGDNSDKLCQLCIGKIPGGRCTDQDPYAGYEGAFRCLLESGEIAFLKHNTILQMTAESEFTGVSKESFELLCPDGSKRSVDEFLSCNWGKVPNDAIAASSATSADERKSMQIFLERAVRLYSKPTSPHLMPNRGFDTDNRNPPPQQPNFDQYGNRINRVRRQNYGQTYSRNNQYDANRVTFDANFDPNKPIEDPNRPNRFDQNRNPSDQFGQNQNQDQNNNGQFDPNRPVWNNANGTFERDPQTINRDQIGVNIDPYERQPHDFYTKNRDQFNFTDPPYSDTFYNTTGVNFYEVFDIFNSSRYGSHFLNLMFQDNTRSIARIPENQQTYTAFLSDSMEEIMGIRNCPVGKMTLCVTSDPELEKCIKMKTALKAQLLKPEMECFKAHSQINCMQAIRGGSADVAVLDASDVYTGGLTYELIPFISEVYNLQDPDYYVVAVAKESDPDTELTYLKGKYTCHGGINTAAGWVYPMAFLLSNGWIRPYGCNSIRAAAEYFTKSCVPGALSTEYNSGVPYDNMCDLCHGASYRYCRRDASEDYYGHTGAFRCLVEGGGHVAFVKHTTVTENTGGKKREWWTRDNLNDDYELLCPDGTRKEIHEYEKCNLGRVRANAIVTRGGYGYDAVQVNSYINLFLYAQTFYGRKTTDEFSFSMFSSPPPYADLIFQDATTQLRVIPEEGRYFSTYLGNDFMRARRIVDCHAGAFKVSSSMIAIILLAVFAIYYWH